MRKLHVVCSNLCRDLKLVGYHCVSISRGATIRSPAPLTQHVEAHEVGVVGEPHDEPDGEEGDLVDVGCEGRHDAGNQEERVREQEGLREKARDGEMSIIFCYIP